MATSSTAVGPRPTAAPVGGLVIGGDYQGLGIARSLGRRGVPVVVLDDERSIARASRYVSRSVQVPELRGEAETIDALVAVCDRLQLHGWVVYPTREETVAAVSSHRDRLAELYRVPTPAWSAVRPAWDKRETYRLAEALQIAAPRSWFPQSEADLAQVDMRAPVILKPAIKEHFFYATGVKAWRADDHEELVNAYRRARTTLPANEVIVQEMVPGGGQQQVAFCAFFKDGDCVASMTVRRRRQHPSDFGRASTFVETIDLPELAEPSCRFLRATGYYGLVELEYKLDPRDGRYKLLDVNARTWGYHTLGEAAGVDFSYLLFCDQVGLPVNRVAAEAGVRWIRLLTDLPNAARDVKAGTVKVGDYLRSLSGIKQEAVFSIRDPLPGLYEVALLPHLAVKRGL